MTPSEARPDGTEKARSTRPTPTTAARINKAGRSQHPPDPARTFPLLLLLRLRLAPSLAFFALAVSSPSPLAPPPRLCACDAARTGGCPRGERVAVARRVGRLVRKTARRTRASDLAVRRPNGLLVAIASTCTLSNSNHFHRRS
ncbi:hypothetical protein GUJ93_ZPchr0001g31353 [Zizania palustris]|uniref:Uncharacterized protein n=1 Tax=Zizania palustris TaxID=103762 RepID=A0A8J5V272_ZIZPA|nr:hypothetical protein GUJ93_ZPchr0001g31353 [Zizania palustris]